MQMGYYKRYGVNFAKSTCILAVRFIGYVLSMCIFYVVTMIVRGQMIYESYNALFWLTTLGFVINFATVLFLLFILINRKLVLRIGMFVIRVLTKISFFKKKKERMTEKFTKGVDEFATAGEFIRKQPSRSVIVVLLSVLSILSLYSITYCIYRGVGLQGAGYIDLFTMQIFLYLAVAFFPTPGAIGAQRGRILSVLCAVFPRKPALFCHDDLAAVHLLFQSDRGCDSDYLGRSVLYDPRQKKGKGNAAPGGRGPGLRNNCFKGGAFRHRLFLYSKTTRQAGGSKELARRKK